MEHGNAMSWEMRLLAANLLVSMALSRSNVAW